jgi:DNA modification methylase
VSPDPRIDPRHAFGRHVVHAGDNMDLLRGLADNSVDAVVTDVPYGLGKPPDAVEMLRDWLDKGYHEGKASVGFMGRKWDSQVPQPALWSEVYRVLKPGGHVLSFFGTRTYDVGTLAMRLAGFEIRDCFMWVFAVGMPKGANISKQIDKLKGAEREVVGFKAHARDGDVSGQPWTKGEHLPTCMSGSLGKNHSMETAPATPEAEQWDGWNTQTKPAYEPIVLARKPLSESSIARNVLRWGTGGINVGGCRVATDWSSESSVRLGHTHKTTRSDGATGWGASRMHAEPHDGGRHPANFIHDGSAEAVAGMPESAGMSSGGVGDRSSSMFCGLGGVTRAETVRPDRGSAARYFYSAKASQKERAGSRHPTVKPLALMRWLVRLVTPPGGVVLDPYLGSGTTMLAAECEGFHLIGAEAEHIDDIAIRWDAREDIVAYSDASQARKDKSVDPAPYRVTLLDLMGER